MERIIVGLDLGSFKIKAAVAKVRSDGHTTLLGLHEAPAHGITRGNITDLASASSAIENLMNDVKEKHGPKIFKVIVSFGGLGLSFDRAKASYVLQGSHPELTRYDIEKVMQIARNMSFSLDHAILHEIVEDFVLDGQEDVKNPIGLFAKKLEVKLYSLFYSVAQTQNVTRCINYAGYDVERIVFSGLVGTNTLLNEGDAKDGAILLDVGCDTTKITALADGKIKFCTILKMGSGDITSALSTKLKIPSTFAEMLKRDSNITEKSSGDKKLSITIAGKEKEILQSEVNDIVEKKMDELLAMSKKALEASSTLSYIKAGLVISGGGSLLEGLLDKAEVAFNLPIRVGVVRQRQSNTEQPSQLFASAVGALDYYAKELTEKTSKISSHNPITRFTHKISAFIEDYF